MHIVMNSNIIFCFNQNIFKHEKSHEENSIMNNNTNGMRFTEMY